PLSQLPSASMPRRSRTAAWASGLSALLTTNRSPVSRMPALAAWIASPMPGASRTITESACAAMSTSAWPTPTVSTMITSNPAASSTRTARGVAAASPPRCPRLAIDRMNTPSSVACSCIRIRSPSSAPPVNGELGSIASTPTRWPASRYRAISALVIVDLPTPGAPVSPITRASPGPAASSTCSPASTRDRSRASARVPLLPTDPEDEGFALAAAAAQARRAEAAAAPGQLVAQVHGQPGAGGADRMPQRDRAAVHVDLLRVDREVAHGLDGHGGERLVDLDQVQVGD